MIPMSVNVGSDYFSLGRIRPPRILRAKLPIPLNSMRGDSYHIQPRCKQCSYVGTKTKMDTYPEESVKSASIRRKYLAIPKGVVRFFFCRKNLIPVDE